MRPLLDTHAFLWWLANDPSLSPAAEAAIAAPANDVHVSAATAWEITTKHCLGKLRGAALVAAEVTAEGFLPLPVDLPHAGGLHGPHKDPFDRMLVAQALVEGMPLVSNERAFDACGVARV